MKATKLQKKYPEQWNNIYDSMLHDLESGIVRPDVLAHNAAFLGCLELHKNRIIPDEDGGL